MTDCLDNFAQKTMKNPIVFYFTHKVVGYKRFLFDYMITCLDRFYKLFDLKLDFLKTKDILHGNLIAFKYDIAYLIDLFKKCNETNLQLQGDDLNIIKTKDTISEFVEKLFMYKRNLRRKEFI